MKTKSSRPVTPLRILSGTYKGQVIMPPRDSATHPMGSREKLALFNMVAPYLSDAIVIDAFAGSGALGYEALSRGAKQVVFLEKSPKTAQIIQKNGERLGLEPRIIKASSTSWADSTSQTNSVSQTDSASQTDPALTHDSNPATILIGPAEKFSHSPCFDLIFADPPYSNFRPELITPLTKLLKKSGILTLSHPHTPITPQFSGLKLLKTRRYASAQISIFEKA